MIIIPSLQQKQNGMGCTLSFISQDLKSLRSEIKRILFTRCNSDLTKKQKFLVVSSIYGFVFFYWICLDLYFKTGIEEPVYIMTVFSWFIFMRSQDRKYLINRYFPVLNRVFNRKRSILSDFESGSH